MSQINAPGGAIAEVSIRTMAAGAFALEARSRRRSSPTSRTLVAIIGFHVEDDLGDNMEQNGQSKNNRKWVTHERD